MSKYKQIHIWSKYLVQIFLLLAEIASIVGGATWISSLIFPIDGGLDILERIVLFYGFYQILIYIILSNINSVRTDEFLAFKSWASSALKACEHNCTPWKEDVISGINGQLGDRVFNDSKIHEKYEYLKTCIGENKIPDIERMIIWAEHCMEESQLQWKYSILLRILK